MSIRKISEKSMLYDTEPQGRDDSRGAPTLEAPALSDEVWEQIAPLLPRPKRKNRKGRPRASDRATMVAILYRLRTGCAWKALPRQLGGASTVYDRFQEWREARVFEHMWQVGLLGQEEFERV